MGGHSDGGGRGGRGGGGAGGLPSLTASGGTYTTTEPDGSVSKVVVRQNKKGDWVADERFQEAGTIGFETGERHYIGPHTMTPKEVAKEVNAITGSKFKT